MIGSAYAQPHAGALRCRSVEAYAAWQRGCMGPPMGGAAPRRGVRETAAACGMARQLRPAASTSTQASGPRVAELARSLLLRRPSPASTSQSECNAPPRRVTSTAGPLSTRSWPRLQARRQRRSALQGPPRHSTSCRSGTRPLHSRGLMRSSAAAQCGRRSCVEAPSARLSTTHADPRAESSPTLARPPDALPPPCGCADCALGTSSRCSQRQARYHGHRHTLRVPTTRTTQSL